MQEIQFSINGETTNARLLGAPEQNPWQHHTVAAVGPKGQLVVRHMTPDNLRDIGDVPIKTMSGRARLDPLYEERGWVMYEDLCAGRVPGVAADPDAWKRWQSLIRYNAAGKPLPEALRNDDKLFHPEVARRRKAGGLEVMPTLEEFRAMFPGFEVDEPAAAEGT